jgi:hypothetical protein
LEASVQSSLMTSRWSVSIGVREGGELFSKGCKHVDKNHKGHM